MQRKLLILFIILCFDFYALQAFENIITPSILFYAIYSFFSVLTVLIFTFYPFSTLSQNNKIISKKLSSLLFILMIPKLFISIFLFIEDIVRVLKGSVNIFSNQVLGFDEALFNLNRSYFYDLSIVIFTGFLLFLFFYGSLYNVYNYKVRKVKLKLLHLPKSFEGLRIIQISDIHSGSLHKPNEVKKAVDKINLLEPDLIFFTGDLVNQIASEIDPLIHIFSQLKSTHGIFSILGNHDYGDYTQWETQALKESNLQKLIASHRKMGWQLLLNAHVHIEKEGEKIAVAGVENWSASNRFPKYGKLQKALSGIQEKIPIFLLSHDPSHWKAEIIKHPAHVDLTFSGHTHGMQFGFEFFKFKWSPIKYFYKQWAGLYQEDQQYLYVNRGFGVIGYPGRVGILPEITLFTIHAN